MTTHGIPEYAHVLLECHGCPASVLDTPEALACMLQGVADSCGLHVVHRAMHAFAPQGVTGYLLLEESHISVHTWPESGFALVNVLSCGPIDSSGVIACVQHHLGAASIVSRSLRSRRDAASGSGTPAMADGD